MTAQSADLVVIGRYLLTLDDQDTIIEGGGIAVEGDHVLEIGTGQELLEKYPGATTICEEHGLIMPGLINTHTHAAMACFRGLADDLPLMQWLQDYIFPVETRLTGEIVYNSTLLSLCEMIKSGTTSFCDMYLFAADVARAVEQSGMRAWIGEVLYNFPSPNYGELANGFIYTEELLGQYHGHPLITVTVDPHSVYTCSPGLLQRLGTLAEQKNALYVIHLAENQDEVNTCQERYHCSPVQHLESLGLLNERVVAAHCVMITDDEIHLLAERGVKVSHCQESNMKLASGTAPVVKMLEAGIVVGIGTDGSASNNDVDMFGEMNTVAKVHKVARMDPTAMDARTTLRAATRGGADVLAAGRQVGSLEAGKKADLIVLDLNQPHLTPLYNPVSHLVYAARGSDVIHSVINGRVVMRNRQLTTLDEPAILAEMHGISEHISEQIKNLNP
ncbi:S-adenosylhomocysteine deaminase; Methylthioadenosine deaminase [hydrothermal vent metagenome]|uniref:S-adenosylhomocysteine deaminase Methylthioadenosine deaminase n=1 Tax=hydrothermal vent metagenome TaxID=652676 RepID=A0A3B0W609_9ZZZZ